MGPHNTTSLTTAMTTTNGTSKRASDDAETQRLRQDERRVVRGVLAVDQQPVEAGSGHDFNAVGARERHPEADLRLAGADRVLEGVGRHVHGERILARPRKNFDT